MAERPPSRPSKLGSHDLAWADAVIGAAVALTVVLIALGLAYIARNRSHLETSH